MRAVLVFFLTICTTVHAFGAEAVTLRHPGFDHAVFALGGRVAGSDMLAMANPFDLEYEDNYAIGLGYQRFLIEAPADLRIGIEVGVATRFGQSGSAEIWGGPVVRHDGIRLFDRLTISPSVTGGLSAVTEPMIGRESDNEIKRDGDATLLFYFGPELNLSFVSHPAVEVFWRLHHRSGAWGTLGDMRGAANVQTLGVRRRF